MTIEVEAAAERLHGVIERACKGLVAAAAVLDGRTRAEGRDLKLLGPYALDVGTHRARSSRKGGSRWGIRTEPRTDRRTS